MLLWQSMGVTEDITTFTLYAEKPNFFPTIKASFSIFLNLFHWFWLCYFDIFCCSFTTWSFNRSLFFYYLLLNFFLLCCSTFSEINNEFTYSKRSKAIQMLQSRKKRHNLYIIFKQRLHTQFFLCSCNKIIKKMLKIK